jgi:hypothetical protein
MNRTRGNRSLVCTSLLTIVALVGLSVAGLGANPARAQSGDAFFPVFVLACDAYVQMEGSAKGEGYPPECRGIADVQVTAYDTQGAHLDSCTTDADGTCRLAIDYNGVRIFRQDMTNIPEGYRPETDVQRVFTYTEFAEIAFHNYSESAFPQRDAPRATVRVHTRICPDGYTGDTFFEDCDAGLPKTNQWIFGFDEYARAGSDGDAVLRYTAAGLDSQIIGGQGPTTGDIFFYCSLTDDPSVQVPTTVEVTALYDGITRDFVGKISELEPQSDVTCDWYQIPNLDRGLWDTVVNVMAGEDSNVTYADGAGIIDLTLFQCPDDAQPETVEDAADQCTEPAANAEVQAAAEDHSLYTSGTTDAQGKLQLSLSGQTVPSFWILYEGHSTPGSPISCVANRLDPQTSEPIEPMYQATTGDEATGWTIPGFGDDLNGVSCSWYLVPSGWLSPD